MWRERKLKQQKGRRKDREEKKKTGREEGRKLGEMRKRSHRRREQKRGSVEDVEVEKGAESSLGLCFRFYKL